MELVASRLLVTYFPCVYLIQVLSEGFHVCVIQVLSESLHVCVIQVVRRSPHLLY